jgi:hypothetical protein
MIHGTMIAGAYLGTLSLHFMSLREHMRATSAVPWFARIFCLKVGSVRTGNVAQEFAHVSHTQQVAFNVTSLLGCACMALQRTVFVLYIFSES